MPLNLVRSGGRFLRKLPVNGTFTRPIRAASSQHSIRRIAFVARRSQPTVVFPCSSSIVGNVIRSFATQGRGRPRKTADDKSTKTKKPAKKAKAKTKEPSRPGRKKGALTDRQKELKKAADARKHKRDLQEAALSLPKSLPTSAWVLAVTSKTQEVEKGLQPRTELFKRATELAQNISAEERKRFEEQAAANRAANEAAYKAWVESHTPLQILEANKARRALARIDGFMGTKGAKIPKKLAPIRDDRLVKRPNSAWIYFFVEKRGKDVQVDASISQAVAAEWRNLPESQKKKYYDLGKADRERYEREHLEVYGVPATKPQKTEE